jgi:hypothetical protein
MNYQIDIVIIAIAMVNGKMMVILIQRPRENVNFYSMNK